MEASMTGFLVSASTGAMNSLLCKLGTLLGDEYKLLKGVCRQIEILRDELSSMNSLLQQLAEVDELDFQRKEWRNKVRELAYDIEDCIDIFMHQQCHDSNGEAGFIRKAIRKVRKLRARHRIALQICELKSRVMEEGARRDRYKLDVPTSSMRLMDVDPRLPAFYTEAKSLVGIDSPRDEIVRWLTDRNWKCCFSEHAVNVVSIVGFGGIGKTTLANQVYRKIRDGFQCAAFVSVSQNPDMAKVLLDILSQIGSTNRTSGCNDLQGLIEKIREHLSQKRYLIVVDDIWSIQVWSIIRCAFINDSNGSRVITTTRIEKVAAACCSYCYNHIYKMKPLSDHHSRRLFLQRIFGSADDCPEQYKNVSARILKKCRGVPLMIISIASLLASQECMCKWESIQKSLVFDIETSPTLGWMRHVLNLSYNDLSHSLKTCFLYLGVYPEDYKIEKANLLRRWIAEGFVEYQYGPSPEEVAESFFNELINRSMILPAGFEYGELIYCQVHDIMRDFILSKSTEENFITTIVDQRYKTRASEVRRLSLQMKNNHDVPTSMSLSKIRSLTIFGLQYAEGMTNLLRFELLRVLDLCSDKFVPSEALDVSAVCKLFQLRFLRIESYQINMPKHIGELRYLETLDIRDTIVYSIPVDITRLKLLRNLNIPADAVLPNGIGKMSALRSLGFFSLADNSVDNIRDLGDLTELRELDIIGTKQILKGQAPCEELKINFLIDSLGKLTNLHCLHVSSIGEKVSSPKCDFLSCWFPSPSNLRRLCLSFCTISKVPEWISQHAKLTSLRIRVKELSRDAVQLLGELPCLAYLDLCAPRRPTEDITFCNNTYRRLREFTFAFTFFNITFEPWTMAKLQVLHIIFAMRKQEEERSSVTGIEHLLNLEVLTARIYNRGDIGASLRNAILRHPMSHTFNIMFPRQ